jgi:arylsulfatase A-like enzyme
VTAILTRRYVFLSLFVALLPVFAVATQPNLVVVLADQLSSDMLGCYGNRDARTPNFDRLASHGVRFTDCVSNSPVCTPFRAMLLTGQHVLNVGAWENDLEVVPGHGPYFAEAVDAAGYHTGYYGKWHIYGGDRDRGIPPGPYRYGFNDEFLSNNCTLVFDAARAYYWDQTGRTTKKYGDWEPYAQTRQVMDFIDRHAGEPFTVFLSWHPPHNAGTAHHGYDAPADLLALYDPAKLTLRPTVRDTPVIREMYQGYLANVSGLDRAMGWLLDTLRARGIADDTIVVFTADHGDLLSSYNQPNHKARPETASCRVPLLIRWPKGLRPGVSPLLLGTLDLMPTLLGLMGVPVPATCQGRNAAAALRAGRDDGIDAQPLFFLPLNWRGVYTRRYTYAESLQAPSASELAKQLYDKARPAPLDVLYDRVADPAETRNLFLAPEAAEIRHALHARTHELMARFGDTGLTGEELLRRVVRPEDLAAVLKPLSERPAGWEGRLRGRPIDLIATGH